MKVRTLNGCAQSCGLPSQESRIYLSILRPKYCFSWYVKLTYICPILPSHHYMFSRMFLKLITKYLLGMRISADMRAASQASPNVTRETMKRRLAWLSLWLEVYENGSQNGCCLNFPPAWKQRVLILWHQLCQMGEKWRVSGGAWNSLTVKPQK